MYHPYQNYLEFFYFYSLPYHQPYFNYSFQQNTPKFQSNLILMESENQNTFNLFQQQKVYQTRAAIDLSVGQEKSQQKELKESSTAKQIVQNQNCTKKMKKIKKTPRRSEIIQKEGRNSHSNILRKFFKMIFVQVEVQPIVEKIIKKYQLQIEASEFFSEIKKKEIDHRNYIRVKEVDFIFEFTEKPVNKIVRILFEHYLKNYYIQHLLSSKKTNNKSMGFHLQSRRDICDQIIQEGLKK